MWALSLGGECSIFFGIFETKNAELASYSKPPKEELKRLPVNEFVAKPTSTLISMSDTKREPLSKKLNDKFTELFKLYDQPKKPIYYLESIFLQPVQGLYLLL